MAINFYDRFHPDYESLYRDPDSDRPVEPLAEIRFTNRSGKLLYIYEYSESVENEEVLYVIAPNIRTSWRSESSADLFRVVSRDGSIDFKFSGYGGVIVPASGVPFEYQYSINSHGWSVDYGWGIPDLVTLLDIELENEKPEKLPVSNFNNNEELNLFNAYEAWKAGFDGTGVKIAIVDTGIIDHPEIEVISERDFVDDDFETTAPKADTERTHGLKVASVIAGRNDLDNAGDEQPDITGIAPKAEIIDVRVLEDGSGSAERVAQGIRYAVDEGARIVQLSLGIRTLSPNEMLDQAIKYAIDHNVLLVLAAGNTSLSEPVGLPLFAFEYPMIVVGNLSNNTLLPALSSALAGTIEYGFYAAPSGGYYPGEEDDYDLIDPGKGGTSYASPYIAGVAALLIQQNPEITVDELLDKLRFSASVPGFILEKPSPEINRISWDGEVHVEGTFSIDILEIDVPSTDVREVSDFSDAAARLEVTTPDGLRWVNISEKVEKIQFTDGIAASPRASLLIDDTLELIFAYAGADLFDDPNVIGQVFNIVESTDKSDVLDHFNELLFPDADDFMPSVLFAIRNVYGIDGDSVKDLVEDFMFATGKSLEDVFWYVAESETADELIELLGPPGDLIFYAAE